MFGLGDPVPHPTPIFSSDFRNSHDPAELGLEGNVPSRAPPRGYATIVG